MLKKNNPEVMTIAAEEDLPVQSDFETSTELNSESCNTDHYDQHIIFSNLVVYLSICQLILLCGTECVEKNKSFCDNLDILIHHFFSPF